MAFPDAQEAHGSGSNCELDQTGELEVGLAMSALGQKQTLRCLQIDVRFTSKSGYQLKAPECPLSAKSRHFTL
jgi:hypothetical protein